jgi:tetratricopeptide (TPR) repeat protein
MWPKKKADDEKWGEMNKEAARLTQEKKLDEALSFAEKAFNYTKKHYGKKDKKTVIALNNLGIINLLKKDFDEAEAYLLLALKLSEKISGKYGEHAAMINMNLAELHSARAKAILETNRVFKDEAVNNRGRGITLSLGGQDG